MTIHERIEHAEKMKNGTFRNDSLGGFTYWAGYLDALKDCAEDYHNLEQSRDYWEAKAKKAQRNLRIMRRSNFE